jgi:hypothetical protein
MRISHALLLMIGCALGFAAYRGLNPGLNAHFRAFGYVYDVVMGSAVGALLAGGLVLAHRRWRGDPAALSQPGHCLLAFGLAAILANGGAIVAYYAWHVAVRIPPTVVHSPYWVPIRETNLRSYPEMHHQAVGWGLGAAAAAVLFCGMSRRRVWWHWQAVFLAIAVGAAILSAGHIAHLAELWGRAGVPAWWGREPADLYGEILVAWVLLLLVALARDAREGRRGDALHWVGIAAWLVIAAMQLALYVRTMLMA